MKRVVLLGVLVALLGGEQATAQNRMREPVAPIQVIDAPCPFTSYRASCVRPTYEGAVAPDSSGGPGWLDPTGFRMYLDTQLLPPRRWAAYFHETGHAVDMEVLTDADRSYLAPILGVPAWSDPQEGVLSAGAEMFASRYSHCARGWRGKWPRRYYRRTCVALRAALA